MPLDFSPVEIDYLAAGKRLSRTSTNKTPLSPKKFWSAFDDYLTLQQALSGHPNTQLETDKPANGVGATVGFEYRGSITRETLVVYDIEKYIWKIALSEPNSVFSFYEASIRVFPSSDESEGAEVTFTIDFAFQGKTPEERLQVLQVMANSPQPQRIKEIDNFILQRDGLRCSFEVDLNYPADKLWAVVGNWEDISWVQYATDVKMMPGAGRQIIFPSTTLEEDLVYADDAERILVYELTKTTLPVSLYRGIVKINEVSPGATKMNYDNLFIPLEGKEPQELQSEMEQTFKARFEWFKSKFNTKN